MRELRSEAGEQVGRAWRPVAAAVVVGVVVLAALLALSRLVDVPFGDLARDVTVVLDGEPYIGALSQVGLFVWAASVTICLFTVWIRRTRGEGGELQSFLLSTAAVTAMLGIDDAFMFHERFGGKTTFLVFMAVIAVWLVVWRRQVARTPYLVLAAAFGFLFLSAALDTLREDLSGPFRSFMVEDGPKLLGILTWCAWVAQVGADALRDAPADRDPVPATDQRAPEPLAAPAGEP